VLGHWAVFEYPLSKLGEAGLSSHRVGAGPMYINKAKQKR
jgi:hypothetical protein